MITSCFTNTLISFIFKYQLNYEFKTKRVAIRMLKKIIFILLFISYLQIKEL